MRAQPRNVGNGVDHRVAQRVPSNLKHAACDEQEKQEGAAHDHDGVHPYTLPVRESKTNSRTLYILSNEEEKVKSQVIFLIL